MNSSEALLSQLRGIQAPEVSGVPAPGWWLLGLIALLIVVALMFVARQYKRLAWRREARAEHPQIDEQDLEALMDVVAKLIDEVKLDNASRVSA